VGEEEKEKWGLNPLKKKKKRCRGEASIMTTSWGCPDGNGRCSTRQKKQP
jgi:hypothetical protein